MTPVRTVTADGGGVVRLILDRGKGNVLDGQMVDALRAEIRKLANKPELRLLIFEGAGPHFSFGASVEEHLPDQVEGMLTSFHQLFRDIEELQVPTAAVVTGQCLGGGFELATWCGQVFCDPSAVFAVPEIQLAVFPPIAAMSLRWRIGGSRATAMIISGEKVGAARAVDIGLADHCSDDPAAAVLEWYERTLATLSPVALRFAWSASRIPVSSALSIELPRLERLYLTKLMAFDDPVEGLTAFLERRQPEWRAW